MSTDTPVQKDEPNASAEQQSAPVQPVSEEPVAPVTETAATDTDAQPSPAPETETVTPPPAEPAPAKPSPVQEEKAAPAPKAAKVSRSPAPEAQPQTSSFASRCFNGLASVGPLVLILFWLIQSMPTFMGRELHALHNLGVGLFGVAASGLPSPELYPVYHWFLSALSLIPGIDSLSLAAYIPGVQPTTGLEQISGYPVQLLPIASALSALFLILLTWALARATGNDRRTAFASGLVLLTGFACMGLPRISGSDMLFTAILTLAGICLYRGWIKAFAPLWLFAGFALVALSALAGGLLGLVLPLLVSLVFLLWRGTFRRAGARDGALAFGLLLVLLLAWGTFIAFGDGGRELLKTLLENEYLAPVLEAWKLQGQDSWIIVALLAVLWLPWTLLLLFLPWGRIGTFFKGIVVNRKQRPGQVQRHRDACGPRPAWREHARAVDAPPAAFGRPDRSGRTEPFRARQPRLFPPAGNPLDCPRPPLRRSEHLSAVPRRTPRAAFRLAAHAAGIGRGIGADLRARSARHHPLEGAQPLLRRRRLACPDVPGAGLYGSDDVLCGGWRSCGRGDTCGARSGSGRSGNGEGAF